MLLNFSKMHGLGNDFVVVDFVTQRGHLNAEQLRHIANRHFGIGCDQILLVQPPDDPSADFRYRIFNADGGEVEQCGNGARCFARFVRERHLTNKNCIRVQVGSSVITLQVLNDGQVQVDMGVPRFAPTEIPFQADSTAVTYGLTVNGGTFDISALSMGNPHAVLCVSDVETAPVAALGVAIEKHARFPQRVNVGFVQIINRQHILLRVFERGVGETLACGTGACAAVVAGIQRGLLDNAVQVGLRGGNLAICWEGAGTPVWMTGPAVTVFQGQIRL